MRRGIEWEVIQVGQVVLIDAIAEWGLIHVARNQHASGGPEADTDRPDRGHAGGAGSDRAATTYPACPDAAHYADWETRLAPQS